jgi:hypothetical protein
MEVSPDHKDALVTWAPNWEGVNADIVARAVVGPRDTYYIVTIKMKGATSDEDKINRELRTMLETFLPL